MKALRRPPARPPALPPRGSALTRRTRPAQTLLSAVQADKARCPHPHPAGGRGAPAPPAPLPGPGALSAPRVQVVGIEGAAIIENLVNIHEMEFKHQCLPRPRHPRAPLSETRPHLRGRRK